MTRRQFSREFKLEAVRLVTELGFRLCRPAGIWMWARASFDAGSRSSPRTLDRRFQVWASSSRNSRRLIGWGVRSPSSRWNATLFKKKSRCLLRAEVDMKFGFVVKY